MTIAQMSRSAASHPVLLGAALPARGSPVLGSPVLGLTGDPAPARSGASAQVRDSIAERMRQLGVSQEELSEYLEIHRHTLAALLLGRNETTRQLGYDRWPLTVNAALDRYEQSLAIIRSHLAEARADLRRYKLPVPRAIASLTIAYPPRRGRKHIPLRPTGHQTGRHTSATQEAPRADTIIPTETVSQTA